MADIGYVADIAHLVAQMVKIAEKDIECDGRTCVSEMSVAINGRSAHIHSHFSLMDGCEKFLCAGECVVDSKIVVNHKP